MLEHPRIALFITEKHSWYYFEYFCWITLKHCAHFMMSHVQSLPHLFLGMAVSFKCPFYDHFRISKNVKIFVKMCFFSKPGIKIPRSRKTAFLRLWGVSWTRRNVKKKGVMRLNFPHTCYGASIVASINKLRKIKGVIYHRCVSLTESDSKWFLGSWQV